VSKDKQVAELASKLRMVPRKFAPGQPGQHVSDFDELARVALDHCAAQPAASKLSDEELVAELRKMPAHLGRDYCAEHEVLPTSHHPDCPRFDKVRQPARIITAAHFAEISALRAELAGLSDELLRLRAELADARGRLADVIQAATAPGGGA
jgi:hypothetical protein